MSEAFDPYYKWLGIPPNEQPPDHYRLLGVRQFEADADVIEHAADARMTHLRGFGTSQHATISQKLLNEVSAARLCLLSKDKKAAYDAQLKASQPAPPGRKMSTAPGGPKAVGSIVGGYELLEQVSTRPTGTVFKARHRTMGRVVALKLMSPQATRSPQMVQRFQREVSIMAKLAHLNLLTAYDAGEDEGTHYLTMEHVDGQDLNTILKSQDRLPVDKAVDYVAQAAEGLQYAHDNGICHRNIKPENLFVSTQGVVKITDLGMAKIEEPEESSGGGGKLTMQGQIMGTVEYMAPEQALDSHSADHRADIYSLGCTLYRLVTGKPPYTGDSPMKKLIAHAEQPIPAMCAAREEVPAKVDAVFAKMVAKQPEDRYQSMREVAADLRAAMQPEPAPAKAAGKKSVPPPAVVVAPPAPSPAELQVANFLGALAGGAPAAVPVGLPVDVAAPAAANTPSAVARRRGKAWKSSTIGFVAVAAAGLIVLIVLLMLSQAN
jgi:hypothetical protein